jgi:hypothetical protein
MLYEIVRSTTDKSLFVIFNVGAFDALPNRIRHLGPWQGLTAGHIERLKLHYRLRLTRFRRRASIDRSVLCRSSLSIPPKCHYVSARAQRFIEALRLNSSRPHLVFVGVI